MAGDLRTDIGAFTLMPLWVVQSALSSVAIHLYAVLGAKYADRAGKAWPSRETLMVDLAVSDDTINRAINELVKKGCLVKQRRYRPDGGQTSNLYILRYSKPGAEQVVGGGRTDAEGGAAFELPGGPHGCGGGEPQTRGTNQIQSEPDPMNQMATALTAVAPLRGKPERTRTYKEVLDEFEAIWREAYQEKFHSLFSGKNIILAKRLVNMDPDDFKNRVRRYITSDDAFYEKRRHSFELFVNDLNVFGGKERVRLRPVDNSAPVIDAETLAARERWDELQRRKKARESSKAATS